MCGSTTREQLLVRTDEAICFDLRLTRGADSSPSVSQCVT